jgi:ankyrin repeat protein
MPSTALMDQALQALFNDDADALANAVRQGHLLDFGYAKHGMDTSCLVAAKRGSVNCLRWMIDHPDARPRDVDAHGLAPLSCAVRAGHVEAVRVLGRKVGVGVAEPSPFLRGRDPLLLAIENGQHECARVLLELGADPFATEGGPRGALACAILQNDPLAVRLLLDAGRGVPLFDAEAEETFLHFAARHGMVDVAEALSLRIDPLASDSQGRSAFFVALEASNFAIAIRLIDLGFGPQDVGLAGQALLAAAPRALTIKEAWPLLDALALAAPDTGKGYLRAIGQQAQEIFPRFFARVEREALAMASEASLGAENRRDPGSLRL